MTTKNGATETYESIAAASNKAVKDGVEKAMAAFGDLNAFSKDNVEAWVASMTTAGKGVEQVNSQIAAFAKQTMEDGVAAAKRFSSVKSVQEMLELQTEFAKSSMETYLAEMNKVADTMTGAVKDAAKPINERVTAAMQMFQTQR